jgi:hypothetical protein
MVEQPAGLAAAGRRTTVPSPAGRICKPLEKYILFFDNLNIFEYFRLFSCILPPF